MTGIELGFDDRPDTRLRGHFGRQGLQVRDVLAQHIGQYLLAVARQLTDRGGKLVELGVDVVERGDRGLGGLRIGHPLQGPVDAASRCR